MSEGLYVEYVNRWQVRIGSLHIWIAAGRWMNEATGVRGKLNSTSIRELITIEAPEIVNGSTNGDLENNLTPLRNVQTRDHF